MSGLTFAEIQEQEDAIFNDNGIINHNQLNSVNTAKYHQARIKALQQLALSDDSPFNLATDSNHEHKKDVLADEKQAEQHDKDDEEELKRLMEEKARLLRNETDEIKRQLDLVRSQINELNSQSNDDQNDEQISTQSKPCCSHLVQQQQQEYQVAVECAEHDGGQRSRVASGEKRHEFVNNQQMTSADSQFNRNQFISDEAKALELPQPDVSATNPRLRPLTGKTDCPNCACDRRRSVCDKCMDFQKHKVVVQLLPDGTQAKMQDIKRQPTFITEQQISNLISAGADANQQQQQQQRQQCSHKTTTTIISSYKDYDERPIRPAKQNLIEILDSSCQHQDINGQQKPRQTANQVDRVVVPNKLYTIGKSLNEKRTKLAQAIEDLQLMMEKVKKRGERLDQERKVAQLYKGQWRFGPLIGGGGGSSLSLSAAGRRGSSESLRGTGVASSYASRLDPNLARDSNSLMGFQHVEPSALGTLVRNVRNSKTPFHPPLAPRPKPRLSKLNNVRLANASNLYRRPTQSSSVHARSKSIESLHARTTPNSSRRAQVAPASQRNTLSRPANQTQKKGNSLGVQETSDKQQRASSRNAVQDKRPNFQLDKARSSSEINLASSSSGVKQRLSESSSSIDDDNSSAAVEENLEQDEIRLEDDDATEAQTEFESLRAESRNATSIDNDGDDAPVKNRVAMSQNGRDQSDKNSNRTKTISSRDLQQDKQKDNQQQQTNGQGPKKVWVPVFGETEIKTIDRRPPEEKKVQRVFIGPARSSSQSANVSANGKSILRLANSNQLTSSAASNRRRTNDRVLNEATKKIQFASDLLEGERHDSKNANQLTIVNRTRPQVASNVARQQQSQRRHENTTNVKIPASSRSSGNLRQSLECQKSPSATPVSLSRTSAAESVISGANKEITRLEEMISEQQALLLKLTQASTTQPCTCCHHHHSLTAAAATSPRPCEQAKVSSSVGSQSTTPRNVHHHPQQHRQLIGNLRDRLNKTKARLARTLEEERAKHQQLEQKVDSSLRKQSDLEAENELLKKSLSKCIDTCLRDISSTFESLSNTLSESIDTTAHGQQHSSSSSDKVKQPQLSGYFLDSGSCSSVGEQQQQQQLGTPEVVQAESTERAGAVSPLLSNAAQLIADNRHLKRMKCHIDTIEQQRRVIFEELNAEKHKSQQLELELEQSKAELERLIEAKRRTETQSDSSAVSSASAPANAPAAPEPQPRPSTSKQVNFDDAAASTSANATSYQTTAKSTTIDTSQQSFSEANTLNSFLQTSSQATTTTTNEDDTMASMTYNSIDTYRHYIQSMTPDLDAIRRERRMILDEFDNIKKMLSNMDNS